MKIFSSDIFTFPLPEGHRFPAGKYRLLREEVLRAQLVRNEDLIVPEPATEEQILSVHDQEYLNRVLTGNLSGREIRRIGLPWSPDLVERTRRSVGGTISASRTALEDGVAVNLSGGTHHAFPDHGQGFCVFNDTAIAARVMQDEALAERILIFDCDVHQGNGTAAIFSNDPSVFTFSIHGARNFPFRKEPSDMDIALKDGASDEKYLEALRFGLQGTILRSPFDLVIYLAGADPYRGDRLGKLALSKAGLEARDQLVLESCHKMKTPVAVVMSGGYGRRIEDTVEIHLGTVRIAVQMAKRITSGF